MGKTIQLTAKFQATAKQLYNLYMNAKQHAETTGWRVKVTKKVGEPFVAGNGYIKGKIIYLAPNKMLAQTWRGKDWEKTDLYSILTIRFEDIGDGEGKVTLVQVGVPESKAEEIKKGWRDHYFKTWKAYLKAQASK